MVTLCKTIKTNPLEFYSIKSVKMMQCEVIINSMQNKSELTKINYFGEFE